MNNLSVTKTTDAAGNESFTFDGITDFDYSAIDSPEDRIKEMLANGETAEDIKLHLMGETTRELMSKVLLKLLVILADSKNIKADLELLISVAGLDIRDESDSRIAEKLGMTRQVFSARKQVMLKRLDMKPPAHSKTQTARETYRLTNQTKYSLD